MHTLKQKFFKSFLALVVLSLVMFVLVGCGKDDKIELKLELTSYEIQVGDEIEVVPTIEKGQDVGDVKLVYSTEDDKIATYVDGKITGVAVGETTVKVAVEGRETVYKNITVKVEAVPTYKVTYNLNGGVNASSNPTTFTKDDLPITLANPSRAEHKFLGWYDNSSFTGEAVTTITTEEALTLYAKWEVIKYTITYNLNEGTLPNGAVTEFAKADLDLDLPVPTRDGFEFVGWFVSADFSGEAVTKITEAKDIAVYAKWTQVYNLTYELDGGTLTDAATKFTADELPLSLSTPTKDGYNFLGWFLTSNFSGDAITSITEAKDVVVYAKWEADLVVETYTITYELDGGTLADQVSEFTAADLPLVLSTPIKDGFNFLGWFEAADFSGDEVIEITEEKDVVLYAKWEEVVPHESMEIDFEDITMQESEIKEFPVTIIGNDDEGRTVKTLFTLPEGLKLEAFLGEEWRVITDYLAGEAGFPLVSETINFRLTALTAGEFSIVITVTDVDNDEEIYKLTVPVVVIEKEATVQEARDANVGDELTVKGVITAILGNNIFLQDDTAAIYVYLGNNTNFKDMFVVGNEIIISGKRAAYNELSQLSNITEVTVVQTDVELPTIITYETLSISELLAVESQRVSIDGLVVTQVPTISSGSYNVGLAFGEQNIEMRVESFVSGYADIKALLEQLVIGQKINLVGIPVGRFNAKAQFTLTDINQIVVQPLAKELVEGMLAIGLKPSLSNIIEDIDLTTTIEIAGVTYNITWESNKPSIIANDGTVVRPASGEENATVVLTAKTLYGEEEITLTYEVVVIAEGELPDAVEYFEDFESSNLPGSYADGSFTNPTTGVTWTYGHSRDDGGYKIDGKGLMLRRPSDSYLTATIAGGVTQFAFKYRKAFTGAGDRQLEVIFSDENGVVIDTYVTDTFGGTSGADNTIHIFSVDLNISTTFTVKIKNVGDLDGNRQTVIDDIKWFSYGKMSELTPEDYYNETVTFINNHMDTIPTSINDDIVLPTVYPVYSNVSLVWESSHPLVISPEGIFNFPEVDVVVVLTLQIKIDDVLFGDSLTYEFEVAALEVVTGLLFDFEDASKNAYKDEDITTNNYTWHLAGTMIGNQQNDRKNGGKSIRLRDGYIAMMFDLQGYDKFSFYIGKYGNDINGEVSVEISSDSGETWTQLSSVVVDSTDLVKHEFDIATDSEFRIKISRISGDRINIDDINFFNSTE